MFGGEPRDDALAGLPRVAGRRAHRERLTVGETHDVLQLAARVDRLFDDSRQPVAARVERDALGT